MGDSLNKAIMIGVGLFVTVIIISGIMFVFSQMQEIYKHVDDTDTSITSKFGKYASYDNTTITGLDMINCANKYYNNNEVVVVYRNLQLNTQEGIEYLNSEYENGNIMYEYTYSSTVEEIEVDGMYKTQITLTKK